ncbi:MAG: hypothetical protein QOI41_7761 [Myxococcales bacterium]|nr:hypothetical protein [Myxococcales bacterium]
MNGDLFSRITPVGLTARVGALVLAAVIVGCPSSSGDAPAPAPEPDNDSGIVTGPPCSRMTTLCGPDKFCEGPPDCASGLCRDSVCHDVVPADGTKNGDETDVDCGGTMSPACPDNKGCLIAADCTSSVCTGGICQVPSPTDGVQNGDETGKDCGGAKAPKCPVGEGCLSTNDCDNVKCDTTVKKCLPPAHDDGIRNLDETGIDCGGPTMTVNRCPTGEGCAATTDCDNVLCNAMSTLCDPPTATDGLTNGTETDKDCGGGAPTMAPRCVFDKGCTADTDCANGGCALGAGKKCAPKSCATTEFAGIGSCGPNETTVAGTVQDSCCKSLVLPTRMKRLDKYEITAGRFRTFLTKAGPNLRAWVAAYVAANPTSQLAQRMASFPALASIYPAADAFDNLSLTAHMEVDIDNYGGIRGCYNGAGDYSANTYWNDATHMGYFGLPPRGLGRLFSDEKPLNCAMPIMFAAFCAWDGGELATFADFLDAWGPARYPFGATDTKRPNYNWCNGPYNNGGFLCQCDGVHNIGASCPAGGFTTNGQAGLFYEFPLGTDRGLDNEPLIAAPGRFKNDASTITSGGESWYDMAANLAEYTGDWSGTGQTFCDFSADVVPGQPTCTRTGKMGNGTLHTGIPNVGLVGDSWEGHQYGKPNNSPNAWPATGQYGKFGARCVRPTTPY